MQLEAAIGTVPAVQPGNRYLLYIHVPFCESLCPFCSFHRVKFDEPRALRYFAALRREIEFYHQAGFVFSDVYVGGGTPTVLPEELARTLDLVRKLNDIAGISVETNPNHLRQPVLDRLRDAGVTRLSVGVQSLEDRLLKEMGRYDSYGSSAEIIERLQATQGQFDTFNVDMIFNIPHQSTESLLRDVQLLKDNQIDQISYYPLMPSTTTQTSMSKQMGLVDFKHERAMYEAIRDTLMPDYQPGSAWCFSRKPAAIDEYIVDHDEYLGIGSGSFSYLNGTTYSSTFSINRYLELVAAGQPAITASRALSISEQAQYDFLMQLFGLRMDKAAIRKKYDASPQRLLWKELLLFKALGALEESGQAYALTREGMYYWVLMMREFFMGVNNFRAHMRHQTRLEWEQIALPQRDTTAPAKSIRAGASR
jgi:coproporphyrinogen III oxidase-like Fe-S oxidoreductase